MLLLRWNLQYTKEWAVEPRKNITKKEYTLCQASYFFTVMRSSKWSEINLTRTLVKPTRKQARTSLFNKKTIIEAQTLWLFL